eukprot:1581378-Rhodomonas_salina.2
MLCSPRPSLQHSVITQRMFGFQLHPFQPRKVLRRARTMERMGLLAWGQQVRAEEGRRCGRRGEVSAKEQEQRG